MSLLLHVFKLDTKSCTVSRGEKVEPIPWWGVTSLWKRMWEWKYCHNHFWKLWPSTIYKLWSSQDGRDPHILATSGLTSNKCGSGAPWVDGLSLGATLRAECGPVFFRVSPNCFSLTRNGRTMAENLFTCSLPCSKLQTFHDKFCSYKLKDSTEHICLFDESVFDLPKFGICILRFYHVYDMDHYASSGLLTGKEPR